MNIDPLAIQYAEWFLSSMKKRDFAYMIGCRLTSCRNILKDVYECRRNLILKLLDKLKGKYVVDIASIMTTTELPRRMKQIIAEAYAEDKSPAIIYFENENIIQVYIDEMTCIYPDEDEKAAEEIYTKLKKLLPDLSEDYKKEIYRGLRECRSWMVRGV